MLHVRVGAWVYVCASYVCRCPQRPQESLKSCVTGVTSACQSPDVGAQWSNVSARATSALDCRAISPASQCIYFYNLAKLNEIWLLKSAFQLLQRLLFIISLINWLINCSVRNQTQGLAHTRKVLRHWATSLPLHKLWKCWNHFFQSQIIQPQEWQ